MASSPRTSVTSELAPPPKVGARIVPLRVDDVDVALALVRAQLVDLGLELGLVGGEQVVGQAEPLPARIVAVEAALEVAGDRRQPAARVGPHPDRVELERGHAEVVDQLPQPRQVLDQRRDDRAGRLDVGERVGDDERLQPGQRLERHVGDLVLAQLLDVDAAVVGDGDRGRPEPGRIGDREVDLVIGRDRRLEGDALRLGGDVAVGVLGEEQPLALGQRRLQVPGLADQAGLALLADGTFEDRLDEDHAVPVEHGLDLGLAGVGAEHLGHREVDEAQELGAVEQAAELHGVASSLRCRSAGRHRPQVGTVLEAARACGAARAKRRRPAGSGVLTRFVLQDFGPEAVSAQPPLACRAASRLSASTAAEKAMAK